MAFRKESKVANSNFSKITISLSSPEEILGKSHGEVLKPETINLFNNCYYCDKDNRRGVGFDKPQLEDDGPTCGCVSMSSFGHSGWTGTFAWADPEKEIVYVFLSNRSYPGGETASQSKLVKENIRSEIQRIIYNSIIE